MRFAFSIFLLAGLVFLSGCVQEEKIYQSEPTQPGYIQTYGSTDNESYNLTNKTPRWGKLSLNIFIDEGESKFTKGFNLKLVELFKEASKMLSNSIGDKLTFNFVIDREDADIEVSWVETLPAKSLDAIGHTEFKFNVGLSYNVITKAKIKLLTSKNEILFKDNQVILVSLHELGHALGLDHSKNKQSIMYTEIQEGVKGPSQEDIQNIIELYEKENLPNLLISEASAVKKVIRKGLSTAYLADVNFSVVNDGLVESGLFYFSIQAGDAKIQDNTTSLFPGGVFKIRYTNIHSQKDFSTIILSADPENRIKELDEENEKTIIIQNMTETA